MWPPISACAGPVGPSDDPRSAQPLRDLASTTKVGSTGSRSLPCRGPSIPHSISKGNPMGLFSKETPTRVQLRTGKELACLTCGFDRFFQRHAQLNSAVSTFFSLDWLDRTGDCVVYGQCGFVHW